MFELYDDEGLTYGYENGEYEKAIKISVLMFGSFYMMRLVILWNAKA